MKMPEQIMNLKVNSETKLLAAYLQQLKPYQYFTTADLQEQLNWTPSKTSRLLNALLDNDVIVVGKVAYHNKKYYRLK